MSELSHSLAETIEKQNEILGELLGVLLKQRDALKGGRHSELQELMSELRRIAVRCQAIEAKRSRSAEELAESLKCEPTISAILAAMPADDDKGRMLIEAEAHELEQTVRKLKIEMSLIAMLMNEARTLNEMLISEWQRLSAKSMGIASMGTFDAKI